MKRLLMAVAAIGVIVALGAPASAAELKAGGWMKVKHIITTEKPGTGQMYPTDDLTTTRVTTARMVPRLEFLATETSGMVWIGEIDVDYGDVAYDAEAPGGSHAGDGAGLAADTANVETKNMYIHFDIPQTPISFRAGITGVFDPYNFIMMVTDAAGFRALADLGDTRVNVDWLRFWDATTTSIMDDVDFYMLTVSQKLPAANASVGGSFYYLKDGSGTQKGGGGVLQNGFTAKGAFPFLQFNAATGNAPIIPAGIRYDLNSYYLGVFGNGAAGPVTLAGSFLYNFGTVEDKTNNEDVDIRAFVAQIEAKAKVGGIGLEFDGIYVSGEDKQAGPGDFGFISSNQYQVAGAFYLGHNMMILLPDADDIQQSVALVYDVANVWENAFLGILALTASANMNVMPALNAKVAAGALWSAEDRLVNGESYMGTEANASLTYTLAKGTTVQLNGAYAWIGDFYEVSQAQAQAFNSKVGQPGHIGPALGEFGGKTPGGVNKDPDNLWYTAVVFRVAM